MMLGMVFFWVAIVLVIAYATKGGWSSRAGDGGGGPTAQEMLEERFARGEISEDEFRERRRVLAGQGS